MKIGLYNLEPFIENTAMMQVSTYHKEKGDDVSIYNPFENYDKVYCFSLFKYTDKGYVKPEFICGGTGFDIKTKLDPEIEKCNYDYSLFPNCKTSYVWFSRGCIRKCPFCVVHEKEGYIQPAEPKTLNPKGEYISIMDNNFFANPNWREAIKKLQKWNQPVNFQSGIDVRLFNKEQGEALKGLKLFKQLHIAWDNPKEDLIPQIKLLSEYIKPYKIMCYILIGYWSTPKEDLYRIESLRSLKIDPFVMPFNKKVRYQKDFARWCNHKAIFKKISFNEYNKNKKVEQ
jgi:hypothetical protein